MAKRQRYGWKMIVARHKGKHNKLAAKSIERKIEKRMRREGKRACGAY